MMELPARSPCLERTRWWVLDDAEAVAAEAARRIAAGARAALARRGVFRIVLAGGRTPERTYRKLAAQEAQWTRWELYLGDERCLPRGHAERNSTLVQRSWLRAMPPTERPLFFPIRAELGAAEGARRYAERLAAALPFDLVLLGLGEDGHTASLFPGHRLGEDELVHAVREAPKPPPERVSLSSAALARTRALLFLVTGCSKGDAVRRWWGGEALPAAAICPEAGVDVLLDREAAGGTLPL